VLVLVPAVTATAPPAPVAADPADNVTAPAPPVVKVPDPDFKTKAPPEIALSPAITLTEPEDPAPVETPELIAITPLLLELAPKLVDKVNAPLADEAPVDKPEAIEIAPLFPTPAVPLLKTNFPLAPLAPPLVDLIVTEPLEKVSLEPATRLSRPPVRPVELVALPELIFTLPPIPLSPAPTPIEMEPPVPKEAEPEAKYNAPELP